MMKTFSGSYHPNEVEFLLEQLVVEDTPIQLKEQLIQSGKKHYSEMLTLETLPDPDYLELFYKAMLLNQDRLAKHLLILAQSIVTTRPKGIVLVSLARAGTPIGVLLKHILQIYFNIAAEHFSISILRDVGIDQNALRYILKSHSPEAFVFVDGWTGKGIIAQQLEVSLQDFKQSTGISIPADLYVLADLCGKAKVAVTSEDYLIPSCILNATISGLVSRSIYNPASAQSGDFHGCVYYVQFIANDLSRYFIDTILARVALIAPSLTLNTLLPNNFYALSEPLEQFLQGLMRRYEVRHLNYIKPGLGEATRVLLRREARLILLKDKDAEATQHLRWLAESKSIPVEIVSDLPYQAVAFIKEMNS